MSDEEFVAAETEDNNKNKNKVRCQYCNSLMLRELQADYIQLQFDLPLMHQKNSKDVNEVETEPHRDFWLINDMYKFENIGFSNTVGHRKYLICADCDMGPVGIHDIDNKKCYVAMKRVRHGDGVAPDLLATTT